MVLLGMYVGLLGVGLASILIRRRPVLVKGTTWVRINVVFALLFLATGVFLQSGALALSVSAGAVLLAISWPARRRWWAFRTTPAQMSEIIERSLARILIPFETTGRQFALAIPAASLSIDASSPIPGLEALTFNGDWRHKKARLAGKLIAKQLRGIVPRITIRV